MLAEAPVSTAAWASVADLPRRTSARISPAEPVPNGAQHRAREGL
jgi:hypothetical protein